MRYIKHAYNAWYSRDLYCSLSFFHAPSAFSQVMPILKLLYNPDNHNAHHIYMSLIILLILSQDENFNKSVHELVWIQKKMLYSPYLSIAPYKGIQDSPGFLIPSPGFQIPGTWFQVLCQWNLDSEFNRWWDSGFLEMYSGFQRPGFQIPRTKISRILGYGFLRARSTQKNYFCCPTRL